MIQSFGANTHQGIHRNYNEDRVSAITHVSRPTDWTEDHWPRISFFAIYDGHGGHACADFLKDKLHKIIINQKSFPGDPCQAITSGCMEAEQMFLSLAQKQPVVDRSGSCAIIVLIVDKECYIANVGDSRAIMSAGEGARLMILSRDHVPHDEKERSRIE